MVKLPNEILDKLRCYVCKEYFRPPVKILPSGRGYCGRCYVQTEAIRSYVFEIPAKMFEYPCINRTNGCDQLLPFTKIKWHEEECRPSSRCCCISKSEYVHSDEGSSPLEPTEEFLKAITCCMCKQIFRMAPIFIKHKDVNVCNVCGDNENLARRNVPLECILEAFNLSCIFESFGCEIKSRFGEEMKRHEFDCKFNPNNPNANQFDERSVDEINVRKLSARHSKVSFSKERRRSSRKKSSTRSAKSANENKDIVLEALKDIAEQSDEKRVEDSDDNLLQPGKSEDANSYA